MVVVAVGRAQASKKSVVWHRLIPVKGEALEPHDLSTSLCQGASPCACLLP
jgi:hypothetical protein